MSTQGVQSLKVLILYDPQSAHITTVADHLQSFARHSCHQVRYAPGTRSEALRVPLAAFDVVIVHYSVRLAHDWHISADVVLALREFTGLKVLFIQDEYEQTWRASQWINQLGIQVVFTCVPMDHVPRIYGRVRLDRVTFYPTLTGYLPLAVNGQQPVPALQDRPIVIAYRGRELAFRYGALAREKLVIGQRMRDICRERGIKHDIEWSDDHRLYGEQWLGFIARCRANLGTESGANVFDFDGGLETAIAAARRTRPSLTFEDIHRRFLRWREWDGLMNQVSPRIFEAIALRTALILFEGAYSNVIRPEEHYIPLKKDFSNVDEVLAKVQDDSYLGPMIERAYQHVIGSGRYTYARFVQSVDQILTHHARRPLRSTQGMAISIPEDGCQTMPVSVVEPGSRKCHWLRVPIVGRFVDHLVRRSWRATKGIARKLDIPVAVRRCRQFAAARQLLWNDRFLRETWQSLRGDRDRHHAFGSLVASLKEFIRLALLRSVCTHSTLRQTRWIIGVEFRDGCIQFTSYPIHDLPDVLPGAKGLALAEEAIRRGEPCEIVWKHGARLPQRGDVSTSDPTIPFCLSRRGEIRFRGLERLARVDPELAIRILAHVANLAGAPLREERAA